MLVIILHIIAILLEWFSTIFSTGDDIFFILSARKKGFRAYCNTKTKAEHLVMGKFRKDEQGEYHHPMYE